MKKDMKIEKIKINKLKPAAYNPRQITTKQYKDLKSSVEKFGLVDPIVVNKDFTIIGGHQRYKICKELKHKEIDCVVLDLSKEEERELNIRLNKNTGDFDMDILANEFDIDELVDWGFKHIDLDINIDKITEGNTEDDHIPEVKESRVKLGDVWELGKHRLMCGDSTKESDVNKLMNGDKADMVFTDPPYGVSYKSNHRKNNSKVQFDVLENDDKFLDFLPNLILFSKESSAWFIWTSHQVYPIWREMYKDYYLNTIIWNKGKMSMGDLSSYGNNYEMALFCSQGKPKLKGERKKAIWEINVEAGSEYKHPTQKPVTLAAFAIPDFINENDLVMDLFLGSGSTLIAAEKLNRKCYGMELDEKYCDVIIERWEKFTGQKAKKL